jgi:signal transduction histidine kinase
MDYKVGDYDGIEIQVEDTGCGIDDVFRERMFEPFTQENAFSPGVGLGT